MQLHLNSINTQNSNYNHENTPSNHQSKSKEQKIQQSLEHFQQSFGNKKYHPNQHKQAQYKQDKQETRIKLVSSFQDSYLNLDKSKQRSKHNFNHYLNSELKSNINIQNSQLAKSQYQHSRLLDRQKQRSPSPYLISPNKSQKFSQGKSKNQNNENQKMLLKTVKQQIKQQQFLLSLQKQIHSYLLQRLQNRRELPKLSLKDNINIKQFAIDFLHSSEQYLNSVQKMRRMAQ